MSRLRSLGVTAPTRSRPAAPRPPLWRRLAGDQNRNLWFWGFVGPFVAGLIVFVHIPILWSLYLIFSTSGTR